MIEEMVRAVAGPPTHTSRREFLYGMPAPSALILFLNARRHEREARADRIEGWARIINALEVLAPPRPRGSPKAPDMSKPLFDTIRRLYEPEVAPPAPKLTRRRARFLYGASQLAELEANGEIELVD